MNEILDNYETFIIVFLLLLAITYMFFIFFIKKDTDLIHQTHLKESMKRDEPFKEEVVTEKDKELFNSIISFLPLHGETIQFLESHELKEPFHGSKLDDLYAFYYDSNLKKQQFLNKILDEKRHKVETLVADVLEEFGQCLIPMEQGVVVLNEENSTLNEKIKKFIDEYKAFFENDILK